MPEKKSSAHIEWIDMVRVVTLLFVVAGHCTYAYLPTRYGGMFYPIPDATCIMKSLLNYFHAFAYSFHMPMFIAVSGACLALGFHKLTDKKKFMLKKVRRLLVPFLLVTLLYTVPLKYISGYFDSSHNILSDIIKGQVLLLGSSHMWFLWALFWIFGLFLIIEPLLRRFPVITLIGLFLLTMGEPLVERYIGTFLSFGYVPRYLFFFAVGFVSIDALKRITLPMKALLPLIVLDLVAVGYKYSIYPPNPQVYTTI